MSGRVAIAADVAAVLRDAVVDARIVRLPGGQLDRALYSSVDRVLKALGGKWDRRAGGHAFPFDPAERLAEALGSGAAVSRQKTLQLFETPDTLAKYLVGRLRIQPDDRCLEPSAGRGRIVRALAEYRPAEIVAVEIDPDNGSELAQIAEIDNLFVQDFLSFRASAGFFTAIAMNPPFSGNQDIRHVRHAFDMLAAGGRLASIVSEHSFIGQERECREWREWLFDVGARVEVLPLGTFAESGTKVATRLIVIAKPSLPASPSIALGER